MNSSRDFKYELKSKLNNYLKILYDSLKSKSFKDSIFYGIDLTIYIKEKDSKNFRVFSNYFSENKKFYDSFWEEYKKKYNQKYSKFSDLDNGEKDWYEKFSFKKSVFQLLNSEVSDVTNDITFDSIIDDDKLIEDDEKNFIDVDSGWHKFIKNYKKSPFNIYHTISTVHNVDDSSYLDFSKWFISCFILIKHPTTDKRGYKLNAEKELKSETTKFLHNSSLAFHEALMVSKQKDLLSKATRSAISQVLIRTMRHNFGHVMDRFIDINDIKNYSEKKQYVTFSENKVENDTLEYNISNFNNYLNNRIALLADIATADPCMETPMSVKSLFKGIDESGIILNRISGIDSFNYSIEFQINGDLLTEQNDFQISMTNDVLGAQAFYIIIENIIRNVAKHAKPENCSLENPVKIIVNFKNWDVNPSFYEVNIYDNVWKEKDKFLHVKNKDDEKDYEGIVLKRNKTFEKTILDSDYSLRSTELGTIEMDICSAYLRTKPVNIVDEDEYNLSKCWYKDGNQKEIEGIIDEDLLYPQNPLLMYAYCQQNPEDKNNKEFSLGYKFFIKKPKEILVVDDSGNFKLQGEENLENIGIKVIESNKINGNNLFNHQILYIYDTSKGVDIHKKLDDFYSLIPKRIVIEDSAQNVENFTKERFFEYVWVRYLKENKFVENESCISIKVGTTIYKLNLSQENKIEFSEFSQQKENRIFDVFLDNHHFEYTNEKEKYYELGCSHHQVKEIIENIIDNENTINIFKYLENYKTKIVILDERIQENIEKRKYVDNVPYLDYFRKQNLIIPKREEANLNVPNFLSRDEGCSSKDNIEKFINENSDADFFIVHLGILEKLIDEKDNKEQNLKNYIENHFSEQKKLIITTGRGNPDNLSKEFNFLSFVSIQTSIDKLFDKFYLSKLIYNTRKHIRNENISIY